MTSPLNLPPNPRTVPAPGRFKILCLSGGGYRGLFSAEVLARLDDKFSPAKKVHERFDLFAGTSVGGLIAAGLALGRPAVTIRDAIQKHGPNIFDDRFKICGQRLWLRKPRGHAGGVIASKFDRKALEDAIDDVLGSQKKVTVAAVPRRLILAATCATTRAAFLMSNIGAAQDSPGAQMTLRNALLATAAAPGYFPALDLETRTLIDGGLVANAPDLVALSGVLANGFSPLSDIRLLSVGTAAAEPAVAPTAIGRRGLLRWLPGLVPLTLDAQEQLAVAQTQAILGSNYKRIDAQPAPGQASVLALDRATPDATKTLLHLAEEAVSRVALEDLQKFLD